MADLVLRPYQQSLVGQFRACWANMHRGIAVLPTGGGKTECAKILSEGFRNPLCMAHTRSLVNQLERRLGCAVTTIQGMRSRQKRGLSWPNGTPDLVIWDEIHHGDSQDWQGIFELIPEGTKMLGLTATPWRFSHGTQQKIARDVEGMRVGGAKNNKHGKGLGDLFEFMIVGVTPKQLVKSGYLVPLQVQNLVEAQDSAARLTGATPPSWDEKRKKATGRITAGSDVRLDPVDAWFRHGEGRKAMVFCHLIAAAERAAAQFIARGISCSVVHGKLPESVVEERLAAFSRGEYQVMCNVMQLTEGYDCPDVGCLIIDRGCNNLNTYIQVCGRGARVAEGKQDCLILDLTGCSEEHGHPQKDQDYWVVTSEGRAVSDLQCEVCGTRLSPMFPQRCMRCDPFRPKLGDPKELLDTGMRVYAELKDIRDSEGFTALSDDERDARVIQALEPFESVTEQEKAVAEQETAAARQRIEARAEAAREAIRAEEARKARLELEEREREMYAKLAAEREERQKAWRAQQAEITAQRDEAWKLESAAMAAKQQARNSALEAPLDQMQFEGAVRDLSAAFRHAMQMKRNLGVAIRDVRNRMPRYRDVLGRESYEIPESLRGALQRVQRDWPAGEKSPAQYELDRMLTDQRTCKFGQPWCRKKVREMFGKWDGDLVGENQAGAL